MSTKNFTKLDHVVVNVQGIQDGIMIPLQVPPRYG